MRNTVRNFWLINVVFSLVLFVLYRVAISQSDTSDDSWGATILQIVQILVSLGISIIYLVVMVAASFTIFLNLYANIRQNFLYSLLSFIAIPAVCIILMVIHFADAYEVFSDRYVWMSFFFAFVYLVFSAVQFFVFRRKLKIRIDNK